MSTTASNLVSQIKAARRVSVPIVAIATPDPAATIETVCGAVNGDAPKAVWDIVSGLKPRAPEEPSKKAIEAIGAKAAELDPSVRDPLALLVGCTEAPKDSVVFMHLVNRWLADPRVVQAIWNLRDQFKLNHRTLVLLGPEISLPAELVGDVVTFDEPLPAREQLETIIGECADAVNLKLKGDTLPRAVEAVQGLPAFQAEQVVAMSLTREGLNIPSLWERKRKQIEQTPGLKVQREPVKYADIGGVQVIKDYLLKILQGKSAPGAIVFIDEIEKFIAGATGNAAGGDSSGVSQDQLGTILAYMQDQQAAGCIFVGPPGSAKSMVAKATGNEAAGGTGVPTIQMDLGAMKGSLVGASEQNLRAALKVVTAVSNARSLWIATCNKIADLPPELRRRFTLGTFFFDLPDEAERTRIWRIWLEKFGISMQSKVPDDEGWTGAEIKQCCDIAWRLGCTLKEAAAFVVPVSKSAAEQLARLRLAAEGKFLSASRPGVYQRPGAPTAEPVDARPRRRAMAAVED